MIDTFVFFFNKLDDFYLVFITMTLSVILRAILKRTLDKLQQDKGYYAFTENRLVLADHLAKLNMGYYIDGNIGNINSVITSKIGRASCRERV